MASLSSPIGPTIDVVAKTISRSVISGGGGGQRGGAIVPVSKMVEPGALVAPPPPPAITTEEVGALKKQINALVKRDSEQLAAYNNLIGFLQNQFGTIGVTVRDLGSNLNATNKLLQNDAQLEQQKENQEITEEKRAAESEYRQGAEKLLEQKIQAALMAPVKAIGDKLQLTLGNIMRFFGILFTGWLVDKAIELFKADSEGNKRKFEDIKNTIIKNLFIAGGILSVLHIGIFRIAGKVASLAFKLSRFVLSNTLGKLFSGIAELAGKLAKATKNMLGLGEDAAAAGKGGAAAVEGAAAAGKGAAAVEDAAAAAGKGGAAASKGAGAAEGLLGKAGKVIKGATGPLNLLAGGLSFAGRKTEGQTNVQAGAGAASEVVGGEAAAAAAARLPLPLPFKILAMGGAYLGGSALTGKASDIVTGVGNTTEKSPPPKTASSKTAPAKSPPPKASTQQQTSAPPTPPKSSQSSTSLTPTPPSVNSSTTSQSSQTSTPISPTIPTPTNVEYPSTPTPPPGYYSSTPITPAVSSTSTSSSVAPTTQPTAEMVKNFELAWQNRNNPVARGKIESIWKNMSPQDQQMAVVWAQSKGYDWNEMRLPAPAQIQPQQTTTTGTSIDQLVTPQDTGRSAEITPPPSSQTVGAAPPPKPNVIYASSRKNQSSNVEAPLKSGTASEVPFIPSSNPDNFYLLYSQVQYNIVG